MQETKSDQNPSTNQNAIPPGIVSSERYEEPQSSPSRAESNQCCLNCSNPSVKVAPRHISATSAYSVCII